MIRPLLAAPADVSHSAPNARRTSPSSRLSLGCAARPRTDMTTLATHPVDDPDLLALIADDWTMTRGSLAMHFRTACYEEAVEFDGWVSPNGVRARLIFDLGDENINKRQLSALWSTACARDGYLDKTDRLVRIEGEGSRGNGNKSVPLRRWRGWVS